MRSLIDEAGLPYARPMASTMLTIAAALSMGAAPIAGAALPVQTAQPQNADARDQDDIIVEGLRLPQEEPQTEAKLATPGQGIISSRIAADTADFFARCVMKSPRAEIRTIVDGAPGRADTERAFYLIMNMRRACFLQGAGSPPNWGLYARGAVLHQVIETYAPKLRLTRADTSDRAVQRRFNAVEIPRNRWRSPTGYRYFEIAVCFVRLEPELSVMLVRASPGSPVQERLEQAIIDRGRRCVGNAPGVTVDPVQFRVYITDAVYRWAIAAKGVSSLLPAEFPRP